MNIRWYVLRATRLNDLVALGSMTPQLAFLDAAVLTGLNVLVSGATQEGKPAIDKTSGTARQAQCGRLWHYARNDSESEVERGEFGP